MAGSALLLLCGLVWRQVAGLAGRHLVELFLRTLGVALGVAEVRS